MLLCIIATYYGAINAITKYKYFKTIEKQRDSLLLKQKASEKKIDSLISLSAETTKRVKKKNKTIDTKHKKDVEEINNSTVSDDELNGFIARHSN